MGFWITNAVAFNGDALRTLAAQFLALAEKQGATSSAHDRAQPYGLFLADHGKPRPKSRALRSCNCALRSCCASSARDAIWSGHRSGGFVLSVERPFGSLAIPKPRSQTRTTPSKMRAKLIKQGLCIYAELRHHSAFPFGKLRGRRRACQRAFRFGGRKSGGGVEAGWIAVPRLDFCGCRQSLRGGSVDYTRARRMPVNGNNDVDARRIITFGEILCGPWPI